MKTERLKFLVKINQEALDEGTDPAFGFRYLDIGAVGRGDLVEDPQEVTFSQAPSRARRVVHEGDTIISTVRTYLRAVWPVAGPTEDLIVSTGFAVLTPTAKLYPKYLGWLAQSDLVVEEVVSRSVGVSYPAINASEIGDIRVPIPTKAQQRAIADYLDSETARIDGLIEKKEQMVQHLQERLQVVVSTTTCSDAIAHGAPPEGWRMVPLARCFASVDYGIGTAAQPTGGAAVLGMGNIESGRVVGQPGGFTDLPDDHLLLRDGDLLFNRTNSLPLVGKVAQWRDTGAPTTFASYLVRLRVSALADGSYMNYLLNTVEVLALARAMALPSIGQANLNPNRYGTMRVPLPSLQVQRQAVEQLDKAAAASARLVEGLHTQVLKLREHRQTLVTAAVGGELTVPGVAA